MCRVRVLYSSRRDPSRPLAHLYHPFRSISLVRSCKMSRDPHDLGRDVVKKGMRGLSKG